MTKAVRDWKKLNCTNCAFKLKKSKCGRTKRPCSEMAEEHIKEKRERCLMGGM